jgi:hypothetical protein
LKIEVDANGLYQVTYNDLKSAGFSAEAVDPQKLHLATGGQEVAIKVEAGADGKLTPGDRILFYGQRARSRYTGVNVYWLYADAAAGLRMGSRPVTSPAGMNPLQTHPVTAHFEENHVYEALYAESSGDHWYWDLLNRLTHECPEFTWKTSFDLPQLRRGEHTARLRISLQGGSFGVYNVNVLVNGHQVGNVVWEDLSRATREFTFSGSWLSPTDNELQVENGACPPPPRAPKKLLLNYFEVVHQGRFGAVDNVLDFWGQAGSQDYELYDFGSAGVRLHDITDPVRPTIIQGAVWAEGALRFRDGPAAPCHYLATGPSAIRSPRGIYQDEPSALASQPVPAPDYLLIGYGPFLSATQPLVDLRQAQGLTVRVVDIQNVYDEFSYGLLDPRAMGDFLVVASGWDPRPKYVLLVGDGTRDYLDHGGRGWRNFVPAYPADVDLYEGPFPAETASDSELDPGDVLPVFRLGRLPVGSVQQTRDVVAKIVNYETRPAAGLWNRYALLIAGIELRGDPPRQFSVYSDALYKVLSPPMAGERVYLAGNPTEPYEFDVDVDARLDAARRAVQDGFGAGRQLIVYMGHGFEAQWDANRLLHRDRVPELRNNGRLPVVLSMTCLTSAFHNEASVPLDERLLLEPGGGALATWGSTGSAVATGHRYLAEGFLKALQGEGAVTVGDAVYAGLANLYTQAPAHQDLIDTFVLLGDPASRLNKFTGNVRTMHIPLLFRTD